MANTNNTCTEPLSTLPPLTRAEITGSEELLLFNAGRTNRAPLMDAVSKANELNACLCVKTTTLNLTSAQVLTIFTTPIAFGITVPTGYYAWPISAQIKMVYNSIPYDTNTLLNIGYLGDPVTTFYYADIASLSSIFRPFDFDNAGEISPETDLVAYIGTGNPTAGNSDISIVITYIFLPVP